MQFSCGQCSTRYAVPDDKVRGKRIRTKCRKCGAEIVVDGVSLSGDPPPSSSAHKPAAAPHRPTPHAGTLAPGRVEDPWTVAISRTDQRKMVTAEVVEAYVAGTITDTTLIWKQGMQKWQPPFEIPALALALLARGLEPKPKASGQRAKAEPPPSAPPASRESEWDDEATRVFDAAVTEDLIPPRVPSRAAPAPAKSSPARPVPAPAAPSPARPAPARAVPVPAPAPSSPAASSAWDDEDEATRMFSPDRALLGRRLPKATGPSSAKPKPAEAHKAEQPIAAPRVAPPGSKKPRPPPVPPRRSTAPAARSVRPPAAAPAGAPLIPTHTKALVEEAAEKVPTVRPPPGAEPEDPFGFEDEATAVITAEKAKALLEEQLPGADKLQAPAADETPMSFGTDMEAKPAVGDGAAHGATREAARTIDDLVEDEPTVVVAESEKRVPSAPPPARSPLPAPPVPPPGSPGQRDLRSIQHERTRVVRAVKKPTGPFFWVALVVALGAAAFAGYYASRLLDATRTTEPEQR